MWVGELVNPGEHFDPYESYLSGGVVYDFPRDNNCDVQYCNIEGVNWIGDNMIVAASDKAKSKGKQPPQCNHKDQMVHTFMVPL